VKRKIAWLGDVRQRVVNTQHARKRGLTEHAVQVLDQQESTYYYTGKYIFTIFIDTIAQSMSNQMSDVGQKYQQRGREVNILLARISTTMFTEQTKADIKMNQVRMDQSRDKFDSGKMNQVRMDQSSGKTNQVRMDQSSGKTNLSKWKQRAINQVHEEVEGLHYMNKAANLIEVNAVLEDGNTRVFFDAKTRWFGVKNNEEPDEQINQVHGVVEGLHNMNKAANSIEVNAVLEDGNTRVFFDEKTRWFGIKNNEEPDEQINQEHG
jgi:hypothetical protein